MSEAEINAAKRLIIHFQQLVSRYIGKELLVYNTHAIIHLPDQVKLFGPLWVTSVSLFESAFGIFKSFVKGSRNEATQMIARFIRFQKFSSHIIESFDCEGNWVRCHGNIRSIKRETVLAYGLDPAEIIGEIYKISVKNQIFTSCNYRRGGNSASYYATALVNERIVFLRIDYIVVDKHKTLTCLCTSFTDSSFLPVLSSGCLPSEVFDLLSNYCPIKFLRYDSLLTIPADRLYTHFVGYESQEHFYAVPLLVDVEHD